ncbi:magnesium ion transporter [Mortierella claussenii]|nr:magnesium ion transporter [Mortierella claussenii]
MSGPTRCLVQQFFTGAGTGTRTKASTSLLSIASIRIIQPRSTPITSSRVPVVATAFSTTTCTTTVTNSAKIGPTLRTTCSAVQQQPGRIVPRLNQIHRPSSAACLHTSHDSKPKGTSWIQRTSSSASSFQERMTRSSHAAVNLSSHPQVSSLRKRFGLFQERLISSRTTRSLSTSKSGYQQQKSPSSSLSGSNNGNGRSNSKDNGNGNGNGGNNSHVGLGAASFAELDDEGADPAATLQKSLAAVPHYAVKNEIKLRCTELDEGGNIVQSTAGEFLKSDLCQQYGLHPRDLRKIDGGFSNQMPVVLVRPKVILVNLGHIRALIKADRVVLFDSADSKDRVQDSPFVKDLQEKLQMSTVAAGGQQYEFRALEAIFLSIVASLHAEMEILVNSVSSLLTHIEEDIDQHKLKELLQYTKKVSRFESRTLLIRDVFEELLDQDEDLAGLYLTEKKEGHPRATDQHDEAEILLEAYMKQVEEIANVVSMVKHQMHSTEDFVNVILGAKRNQLLLFELRIAMGTLGISSGALIAGLYGMNLQNYLENDPYAFFVVSAGALALGGSVFVACGRKLRILARGTT